MVVWATGEREAFKTASVDTRSLETDITMPGQRLSLLQQWVLSLIH